MTPSDAAGSAAPEPGGSMPYDPSRPQIISGKIMPPRIPETVVPRPRVESRLAELISRNHVVCVCATAGAGKTTAVRQAAVRLALPVGWLSVDTTDVAPGRLLTYLEAAVSLAVPGVHGVVRSGLAARLSHREVAGLLADTIGDAPILLVLDDLERLADSPEALTVLGTFLRYTPPAARVVLISRRELPFAPGDLAPVPWLDGLGEDDLAFTVEEAATALARNRQDDIDPAQAIAVTGGWVTGVLFEAWRSTGHAAALGGEADPLHGYLAMQILDQLEPVERDFLIATALLHEVTADVAEALGLPRAAERLHALRRRHLPATWDAQRSALRCHPRFREYLLARLERWDEHRRRALHRAHAEVLAARHHPEEAVEEFLAADALDEALDAAERVLETVIERGDVAVAERWLGRLEPVRQDHHTALAGAELMLAIAHEDYRRGMQIADRLAATGHREELAASSSQLASMLAWCYLHGGRVGDIRTVLAAGHPGPELDAMRYCMTLLDDDSGWPTVAPLTGGPLDALIMRVHYYHGRLPLVLEHPASPWAAKAAESWRLGALLAMGHVEEGARRYRAICAEHDPGVWLYSLFNVQLQRELGERDAAWRALLKGRERLRASGSVMLEMLSHVEEAALELRFNHDTRSARAALERVTTHPVGAYAFIAEQAATWLGLALLLDDEDAEAVACLRHAVDTMRRSGRILLLPVAAIYLAEAEWRAGNESNADEAADRALAAAEQQGSNHLLLDALTDFPVVLSRRLDAESTAESSWHDIGRALMTRGVELPVVLPTSIRLREFGTVTVEVNGVDVRPRIKKSYELLAYLADRRHHDATKDELLDALFEGRHDDSAAAYLRQAVRKLREVLPDGSLVAQGAHVRLSANVTLISAAGRFHGLVAQAASLRGVDRLTTLLEALDLADGGPYLPGLTSPWIEERRRQLAVAALDARCQAAELAFTAGDYRLASTLAERIEEADPFRESVWRLSMRIADATGDSDGVIAAYRACEHALRQLGTRPSPTTHQLLENLRR